MKFAFLALSLIAAFSLGLISGNRPKGSPNTSKHETVASTPRAQANAHPSPSHPLAQAHQASQFRWSQIERISPAAFQAAREQLEEQHIFLMIQDLAARDPRAASELIDLAPEGQRIRLIQAFAKAWSIQEPIAALRWITDQAAAQPNLNLDTSIRTVLENYAKRDPKAALSHIHYLDSSDEKSSLLFEIGNSLAEQDPLEAIRWLASLDPDSYTPEAISDVYASAMFQYASRYPNRAAQAIVQLESIDLQRQLAPQTAVEMANNDITASLIWIHSLEDTQAQQASIAAIAEQTLRGSPEAAIEALLSFPHLLEGKPNPMHDALQTLAPQATEALKERFDGLPPTAQAQAAQALTQASIDQPEKLPYHEEWLSQMKPGKAKDSSLRLIAQHYTQTDPIAALLWASQLSNPELRRETFRESLYDSPSSQLPRIAAGLESLEIAEHVRAELSELVESRVTSTYAKLILP